MKKLFIALFVAIIFSQMGFAQNSGNMSMQNTLSGAFVITGEGGITLGQTDYSNLKPDYIGKLSLEYYLPMVSRSILSFRVTGGKGFLAGKSTTLSPTEIRTAFHYVGGSLVFNYQISEKVYPFIAAGASHMWVFPRNKNDVDIRSRFKIIQLTGDIGLRIMVSDNLSLNISGGFMTPIDDPNDDQIDAKTSGKSKDWIMNSTLGLSIYFNINKDSDSDGIYDSKDMCPGTAFGVTVDEFGCPVDSDNDGVANYLDKCPNTPAGVNVDFNGCPLDADRDGIADYLDKCPNTPAGANVNVNGCPFDSDGDGVADYLDKCPSTPQGINVDLNGCPIDSDGDGVPDNLDKCPNTPKDREVDVNGCTIKKEIKTEVMGGDANFESNKAVLLPYAFTKLEEIANTLKDNPDYYAKIYGYTDSIGSEESNLKLSYKRAQAVADYLVLKGINRSRLQLIPMGEANPIVPNNTADGRAANRRVEIKISQK
ncbi:MAG TPA: OmpA family protein [Ignavibacteriaceae bacterium]|nr:OmpA family protein [Ignavibacteriaceae bacterium]